MPSVVIQVHVGADFEWGPLSKFAPELSVEEESEMFGLRFLNEQGQIQVFVFDEGGRDALRSALSGGIVVAGGSRIARG